MTQSLPPKSVVLYADDDPDDRELLHEAFKEYAHAIELTTFKDGLELLQFIDRIRPLQPAPCLVILDINMPRLDGKATLQRLRNIEGFEEVPAVLFSTSTLPSEISFARRLKAGFVTKPLHTLQIHLIVDQLIEHCTDEVKKSINWRRNQ